LTVGDRYYNTRAVIDACIPYERIHDFPPVARTTPEFRKMIFEKWPGVNPVATEIEIEKLNSELDKSRKEIFKSFHKGAFRRNPARVYAFF
jgi:hypothetical protein